MYLPLISVKNEVNFSVPDTRLTGSAQKCVFSAEDSSPMTRAVDLQ